MKKAKALFLCTHDSSMPQMAQLVCPARALLADSRKLIMNEATSGIDDYTEPIIQQAMNKILMERASKIIARHLSIVRNADVNVVLDGVE